MVDPSLEFCLFLWLYYSASDKFALFDLNLNLGSSAVLIEKVAFVIVFKEAVLSKRFINNFFRKNRFALFEPNLTFAPRLNICPAIFGV